MRDPLSSIADSIRRDQAALREKARGLRNSRPELILKTDARDLTLQVCAVDGGLLAYRLHGHDVVASRSVAVSFRYEGSALRSFDHYPARSPGIEITVESALDEHEANVLRSLVRLKSEIMCAITAVERYSPELLLMDGSLWTVPSDRPAKGSRLARLYDEVTGLYRKLYDTCGQKTFLCGVIKDSRSRKLAASMGFSCSDTLLCSHMLDKGERTPASPYSDQMERLRVFYMKPSEHDLPLRIEFMEGDEGEIASLIFSLSSISESFAYPAILIEADMRAAMSRDEAERLQADIGRLDMRPLRRNSRPFR